MYKARFCHSPQGAWGSPPFPTAFHPLSDTLLETELPIRMGMVPLLPSRSTPARSIPACSTPACSIPACPLPTRCPRGPALRSPSQFPRCTPPSAAPCPQPLCALCAGRQPARPSPAAFVLQELSDAGTRPRCCAPKCGAGSWLLPAPGQSPAEGHGPAAAAGCLMAGQAGWSRSPSLCHCLGVSVISLRGRTCPSQSSPDHEAQLQLDLLHRTPGS